MKRTGKRIIAALCAIGCVLSQTACGASAQTADKEIELLEPVGVTENYEVPAYRNIYSYTIHSSYICPYVEEYAFDSGQSFSKYVHFPGESVKKGTAIISGDTTELDKQIESLEETIAEQELQYREKSEELQEQLAEPKRMTEIYEKVYEDFSKRDPSRVGGTVDESIWETPEYISWKQECYGYESIYRNNLIRTQLLEAEIRQSKELYELDHAYNLTRLENLKKQRSKAVLTSDMNGYIMGVQYFETGNWISKDQNIAVVGDISRKQIRCEYLSTAKVRKAEECFAFVNGKRYEVEYQTMDNEEYKQLSANGEKVYSTFLFTGETPEIQVGDYGVIVLMNTKRENVLSISRSCLHKDGNSYYVYVQKGEESVATPVKLGATDSIYAEILSGLSTEDKVVTEKAFQAKKETVEVSKGTLSYEFKSNGYLFYPSGTPVYTEVEYGSCYLAELSASRYERVEKGQLLATVRVEPDTLTLQRLERQLSRAYERLEDDRKIENEKQRKKQIEAREKSIAELEETISEMKKSYATRKIYAPASGVIIWKGNYEQDDLLDKDRPLYVIADESTSYVLVEDENHSLNFGNRVTIEYMDANGQEASADGTVATVTASALTDASLRQDYALISVSAEALSSMAAGTRGFDGYWSRSWYTIKAQVREMQDVILVPKSAVTENSGQYFVSVKQPDGSVVQTGIVVGGSDMQSYWVIQGLTEGMELCLK